MDFKNELTNVFFTGATPNCAASRNVSSPHSIRFSAKARTGLLCIICSALIASCGGGSGSSVVDDDPNIGNSNTAEFSSTNGGFITANSGQRLIVDPGVIPNDASGIAVPVVFSVETGVPLPSALPATLDALGAVTKFGPDGFDFAWPLSTTLPIPDTATDLNGLRYMRYDPSTSSWVRYPAIAYTVDESDSITGASVASYTLGYDTLALNSIPVTEGAEGQNLMQIDVQSRAVSESTADGAFSWNTNSCGVPTTTDCSTYFVIKRFKPKYPDSQKISFENWFASDGYRCTWNEDTKEFVALGDGHCGVLKTGNDATGEPAEKTTFTVMQGAWEFCATKSQWVIPGGFLPLPGKWTYSELLSININAASQYDFFVPGNWTNVNRLGLPESGSWLEPADMAACPTNNNPTIPVGTGDFQATLTWINTDSTSADLDLHLYGPNDLHVFWASSQSPDGTLQLDRDWQNETGSAVENIFSDANFDSGEYRLTAKHYSGSLPINFSVRIVLDGASNTYQRSFVSDDQEIEISRFTQ